MIEYPTNKLKSLAAFGQVSIIHNEAVDLRTRFCLRLSFSIGLFCGDYLPIQYFSNTCFSVRYRLFATNYQRGNSRKEQNQYPFLSQSFQYPMKNRYLFLQSITAGKRARNKMTRSSIFYTFSGIYLLL